MRIQRRETLPLLVLTCVYLSAGCGGSPGDAPDTVPVHGTVTMDGQPLANAMVTFVAANSNDRLRTVSGVTNADGEYTLEYSLSTSGAQPGSYIVSISTQREADMDEDGNTVPATPETVPRVYNAETTLTAEVSADKSQHDFELSSSEGEVVQAPADADAVD